MKINGKRVRPRPPLSLGRDKLAAHEARFVARLSVGLPDDCWPICRRDGIPFRLYAGFSFDGMLIDSHRFAYLLWNGPIPEGLWVLHSCDNPPCCNPAHLWLGTPLDNIRDMQAKGRNRTGETNPMCRLSDEQVTQIRHRAAAGEQGKKLAEEFGVSRGHISQIVSRQKRYLVVES